MNLFRESLVINSIDMDELGSKVLTERGLLAALVASLGGSVTIARWVLDDPLCGTVIVTNTTEGDIALFASQAGKARPEPTPFNWRSVFRSQPE